MFAVVSYFLVPTRFILNVNPSAQPKFTSPTHAHTGLCRAPRCPCVSPTTLRCYWHCWCCPTQRYGLAEVWCKRVGQERLEGAHDSLVDCRAQKDLTAQQLLDILPMAFPMTHTLPEFPGIAQYPIDEWEKAGPPFMRVKSWAKLAMGLDERPLQPPAGLRRRPEARRRRPRTLHRLLHLVPLP